MILATIRRCSSHHPFTRCRRRLTSCPYHLSELIINRSPPSAAAARLITSNRAGIIIICSSSSISCIQHRGGCMIHYQRACWLSSISSSPLEDKSSPSSIKVTVTSNAPTTSCHHNSTDSAEESSSSSSSNHPKKSPDQIAEEEILSLQSELRVHYRHASYDTALDTANQLLSLTMKQFGKLHPATASAYNNVGLMNKCLGKYVEAREAYHEALRIYGTLKRQRFYVLFAF